MSEVWQPHPGPQTDFMSWTGRYGLYGGAANSGKSDCLMWDPFRQIKIEQNRVNRGEITTSTGRAIYFRRTMPELREMIDRAKRKFPLVDPGVQWHEQTKTFTFSCGYKYMFGQMEEDGDWMKYYGFEFTEIIFDELTTFTQEQFDQLDTRLRSSDPVLKKLLYMRAGTNPVGPGLEWVRARFVEPAPPRTPVIRRIKAKIIENGVAKEETVEHAQIFIPARVSDNLSVDQAEYTATLMTKSSATRRQLLEGDWYVSAGSCFGELWDQDVHVCKPFKIPPGWTKFRAGDYGHTWPGLSSIGWVAVDTDGNFIVYRSLAIHGLNAAELGTRIREIEIDNHEWDQAANCSKLSGPLDSSCFNTTGHVGLSIGHTMNQMGLRWREAPRSETTRQQAADQFRQRLTRRTGHPTLKDEKGRALMCIPGIRFFDTCWNYVKKPNGDKVRVGPIVTIPVLASDDMKPDVWDTKGNDHDMDMVAYGCMFRPLVPTHSEITREDEDELARARKRAKATQATGKSGYWKAL